MQIGEPWWWYNPATNLPCIYDYSTRLAFNQDTGLYAPDLETFFNQSTRLVHLMKNSDSGYE